MKVRKVVNRSGRGFRGYFPSRKLGRLVEWESLLERDAIILFEFSNGIKSYQEQPELIVYEQDGEMRRYFPDFSIILTNDKNIHYEVKPLAKLISLDLVNKYSAVKHHYERLGRDFRILVDQQIRIEPRLSNLKLLARVQHFRGDLNDVRLKAITLIKGNEHISLQKLSEIVGRTYVLVLLAHGDIRCNMTIDLNAEDNFLRLPKECDHAALFI
jgi:hypothetical protein